MKKTDFTGTGRVFSFTLAQYMKNKSTLAMFATMLVLSVVCVFIVASSARDAMAYSLNVESLVIVNNTGLDIRADDITGYSAALEGLEIGFAAAEPKLENNKGTAVLRVDKEGENVTSSFLGSSDQLINDYSYSLLGAALEDAVYAALFRSHGVSDEQMSIAFAPFTVGSIGYDEYVSSGNGGLPGGMGYFFLSYFYSIIVMMLVMFSTSYMVRSVVEEKASKLVELLMVSVRPLALLLGKILSTMVFMIISLVILALGTFGAATLAGHIFGISVGGGALSAMGIELSFDGVGVVVFLIALVSIILGYLTFSIIGGISGASCSAMEDINSANNAVAILALLGYMASIISPLFGSRALTIILSLCPIISVFTAPVSYAAGVINIWILALSWLIQLAAIAGLASFGARVYSTLLIYRGNRIKLRQLFKIARESGKEA